MLNGRTDVTESPAAGRELWYEPVSESLAIGCPFRCRR